MPVLKQVVGAAAACTPRRLHACFLPRPGGLSTSSGIAAHAHDCGPEDGLHLYLYTERVNPEALGSRARTLRPRAAAGKHEGARWYYTPRTYVPEFVARIRPARACLRCQSVGISDTRPPRPTQRFKRGLLRKMVFYGTTTTGLVPSTRYNCTRYPHVCGKKLQGPTLAYLRGRRLGAQCIFCCGLR